MFGLRAAATRLACSRRAGFASLALSGDNDSGAWSKAADDLVVQKSEGGIGTIIMDRPKAFNAVTLDMIKALRSTTTSWNVDPEVSKRVSLIHLHLGLICQLDSGSRDLELISLLLLP